MKCYCLTLQTFSTLKEKYMTLRQLGKLPKPMPIIIQRRNISIKDDAQTKVDEGIEYAKKLLKTTNLQIQTVAGLCGIDDVHYFSKMFKNMVGLTPKGFRESIK